MIIEKETINAEKDGTARCIKAQYAKSSGANFERNGTFGSTGVIVKKSRTPLKFLDRNQKNIEGDYAYTVDTCHTGGIKEEHEDQTVRIRKLTPKECWRLMGFDDEDFEKAEAVCSNTQLYKQAGNSIVVPVLEEILKKLRWLNR